ncbi:MAG: group III truncated hemoglobin [Bdellovibrionaceae bacterium]|nr:group III truncated hemoglobin [Pseudobdellovibrionaceae bacterium]
MKQENQSSAEKTVNVNGVEFAHDDIFRVVDDFYTRIQRDPILQVPFRSVGDWPEHIQKLTHFWWVRFGGKPYLFNHYNPVAKHFFAGFNHELLTRWLFIFHDTLQMHLTPEQVGLWKLISAQMGKGLSVKNELFRREYESREREVRTKS